MFSLVLKHGAYTIFQVKPHTESSAKTQKKNRHHRNKNVLPDFTTRRLYCWISTEKEIRDHCHNSRRERTAKFRRRRLHHWLTTGTGNAAAYSPLRRKTSFILPRIHRWFSAVPISSPLLCWQLEKRTHWQTLEEDASAADSPPSRALCCHLCYVSSSRRLTHTPSSLPLPPSLR